MPTVGSEEDDINTIISSKCRLAERRHLAVRHIQIVFASVSAALIIFRLILGVAIIRGTSMVPAFRDGDVVLFIRVQKQYRVGDVVLIETDNFREDIFKRIVGLPGQTVDINEATGKVLINGKQLSEPYIYSKTMKTGSTQYPVTLKENEYFVLGDNRQNSRDSRMFGPVNKLDIDGKVCFTIRVFN